MGSSEAEIDAALAQCNAENGGNCDRAWFAAEAPQHTVYLDAYSIDKYEVANARYQACVDAGGCTAPHDPSSATRTSYYGNPDYAGYPVINVDWGQAETFCAWEGKRLPTEAEWEKAARGTDGRIYPWGNQNPTCDLANGVVQGKRCVGDTSPVGSYAAGASPYGVMDMAGNVWEWVNDWYDENYYSHSPASNPPGPATGDTRVLRGGSWALRRLRHARRLPQLEPPGRRERRRRVSVCPLALILASWLLGCWVPGTGGVGGLAPHARCVRRSGEADG